MKTLVIGSLQSSKTKRKKLWRKYKMKRTKIILLLLALGVVFAQEAVVDQYGVYIVCSRNWQALGNFGLHVGINKNITEEEDRDDDLNLFFGFDKELNRSFSIFAEYNFARDDDDFSDENDLVIREGNGYLNAGLRWSATENLMLEINLNDFAKNNQNSDNINRELKVIYFEQF